MVTKLCKNKCCKAVYCPLALSFAKTCHTFQGQSAGPVNQGQQPNAVDRVVVDPGDRKFEGSNPGLLYMAVSRATTLGDCRSSNNNKPSSSPNTTAPAGQQQQRSMDSAIYFTGHNMTKHRALNLTVKATGEEYKKIGLRRKWVKRIETNTVGMELAPGETPTSLLEWCKNFKMDSNTLEEAISNPMWRHGVNKDLNY